MNHSNKNSSVLPRSPLNMNGSLPTSLLSAPLGRGPPPGGPPPGGPGGPPPEGNPPARPGYPPPNGGPPPGGPPPLDGIRPPDGPPKTPCFALLNIDWVGIIVLVRVVIADVKVGTRYEVPLLRGREMVGMLAARFASLPSSRSSTFD